MALDRDPNHVFRDFVTDGIPSSGTWNPRKPEIRQLLTEWWQTLIALVADAGGLELPNLLIRYEVTGGDENNIIAEANLPVPSGPGVAVFSIVIEEANTGPVTINGKPLLSNTGNPLAAGALAADGIYLFLDNGDSYRLLSDYVSSSIVAAAEAAAVIASGAAGQAVDAAERAESAAAGVEYPVSYAPQTLTPEQQEQARENIGAASAIPSVIVLIPTDFATIQDAVDHFSRSISQNGEVIEIRFESGHNPASGLTVSNGDFGRFRITSEDAEVVLSPSFPMDQNFITARNARIPVLATIVNMNNRGRAGLDMRDGCTGRMEVGSGFKNAVTYTLDIYASRLDAIETIYDGCAGSRNVHVTHGASVNLLRSIVRNSANTGLYASHSATIAAYDVLVENTQGYAAIEATTNASIDAFQAVINNSSQNAIYARTSGRICAQNATVTGADYGVRAFSGAIVAAPGITISGANYGVSAESASIIDVGGATINGCGTTAISASDNSRVNAKGAKCNNAGGDALFANYSSSIEFSEGEAKNAGGSGAVIRRCSSLDAIVADFSGASGPNGVFVREGSTASLLGANCRKGGSDATGTNADIRVQVGGLVSCNSSTIGGTSGPSNTVSLDGIIFKP